MALPCLSGAIPLAVVPQRLAAANASIARFLIQAGAIREGDVPDRPGDAMEVCQAALDAWIKRELGPLHCLSPVFNLRPVEHSDLDTVAREPARTEAVSHYRTVMLDWCENREQQWIVGEALEALEHERPGLGPAVLNVLRQQSRFVYPLFTPDVALDVASYLYWCGEEDEDEMLAMECDDDEDEKAVMRAEMVTRQSFDDTFPRWALEDPCQWLPVAAIEWMADGLPDQGVRDIVADVLALARLRIREAFSPEVEGEYLGWGAVLSWREDDISGRIYDDLTRMAYESDYCDRIGELVLALDEPQAMRRWRRAMRPRFEGIRLIDRLIHRLAA
ncbi:MAG: PRTRC system protein F [Pseudomonadota bacterium]